MDLQGNKYFIEYRGQGLPDRRLVEYADPHNQDLNSLDVAWWSWLSGTRDDPPSLDELEKSELKRQQMAARVAALEAADRKQRLEQMLMGKHPGGTDDEDGEARAGKSGDAMARSVHMIMHSESERGDAPPPHDSAKRKSTD